MTVACGADSVSFDVFRDCISATWKFFEVSPGSEDGAALRGLLEYDQGGIFQQDLAGGLVRCKKLLEVAGHARVTDRRDMVFAFRGGIGDHKRTLPELDYTVSVEDVYLQTAEALLPNGHRLISWLWLVPQCAGRPLREPFVLCDGVS